MQQWQVGPVPNMDYYRNVQQYNTPQAFPPPDMARRDDPMNFPFNQPHQSQHPQAVQPPMGVAQPPQGPPPQQQQQQAQPQAQQQAQPQQPAAQAAGAGANAGARRNKRPAPEETPGPVVSSATPTIGTPATPIPTNGPIAPTPVENAAEVVSVNPPVKKSRTNTPWTAAEEQRLKQMRDAGHSWAEIAKSFPNRTEGSVKKHWYKDMHYAEFGDDEREILLSAIKEYEKEKWKVIGQKVGKPAKACEQFAKQQFPEIFAGQIKLR